MRLDLPLRQLLSRFSSIRNAPVTLLYQSPTLTKQIYTFDQAGSYARDAARSKIREGISYNDPVCVSSLGGDAGSGQPCTMLAYSDREETLRSLYAWLNRANIRVSSMIPTTVASIVCATDQAMSLSDDSVMFYFDSDISIIAHAQQGHMKLVRPADIGYEKLAESYQQVFREKKANQENPPDRQTLSAKSHECLFQFGIPFQPHEFENIELRSSVLPCMAPVLQRIGIDVKQTIRFGIENGADLKNLYVCGPGAAIPGISKAVGEHLELHVQPVQGSEHFESAKVGGNGSTVLSIMEKDTSVQGLLPAVAHDERLRKRLGRSLLAGSAVALLAMGAEYTIASLDRDRIQHQIMMDSGRMQAVSKFQSDRSDVQQAATMLSDIAGLVKAKSKPAASWGSLLAEVGNHTGTSVRVQELRGEYPDGSPFMLISGYVVAEGQLSAGQVLDGFVANLRAVEHVDSIKLGATSRVDLRSHSQGVDNQWGLQFTMRVLVNTAPFPYESYAASETQSTEWMVP